MTITREAVIEITAKECGLDKDKLTPEMTLADLDVSSIDLASAVFTLEDEFGIEVDPADISREWTIGEFLDHVMNLAQRSDQA